MRDIDRKHFSADIIALNPELFGAQETKREPVVMTVDAPAPKRGNKYGARKTVIGDLTFDSKKEANRYLVLKSEEDNGTIIGLLLQHEIVLQEGFEYRGKTVQSITYTADFVYERDGTIYIEDVKSKVTAHNQAFRIRWRLLQYRYKDYPRVICLLTGA